MTNSRTNQVFSFSRWRLLVAKQWAENRRRYLLSMLAIGGLIAVWEAFLVAMVPYAPLETFMQFATYMVGLFFTGCLFASTLFSDLGSKKLALTWLSLPASHLEKLLCAILFGVVLFYLAFTLVFYLVDIPMVQWANSILHQHPRNFPGSGSSIPPSLVYNVITADGAPVPEKESHVFTAGYFAVQSIFLLGSVYFTRFSFMKTVVAGLLFMIAFVIFQKLVLLPMKPEGWSNEIFRWTQEINELNDFDRPLNEVRLAHPIDSVLLLLAQVGIAPFFWLVTWVRLKEKEV
jgi:hypothetical protein